MLVCFLLLSFTYVTRAQVATLAPDYKIIDIGTTGGDYTKNLILLHEMYNGTLINMNNAVGTITAFRGTAGSLNRINIVEFNTSSAYGETYGTIRNSDNNGNWSLKTCFYNGKKYLALDVPYWPSMHDWGFQFAGWTKSSGENMKSVNYEISGQPVNTSILTDIRDFIPNMNETHQVNNFLILGNNVGIGTANPTSKLTVAGNIASREVKVTVDAGADFVFEKNYDLPSLESVDKFIKENKHLPEIASAEEMKKDGVNLSEMNIKLLQKIEEMTLYMIEMKKQNDLIIRENESLKNNQKSMEKRIQQIESKR
ncbi:hypothetical protein [Flavobacterium anhuiense]|uniref:hypothetical protein n=1 Tax=Flavobacterium anhuiense TaxID=459526 RepID=UPI0034D95BE9